MDKIAHKKTSLQYVRFLEGTDFKCDEKAILEEFKNGASSNASVTIKVLSIFGGFLATLAFISFLLIAGLYDSKIGLLLFGVGFICAAIVLNKKFDTLIIDTFSVSLYFMGFVMLSFSLFEMKVDENFVPLIISAIALCALFITQNYMLSFISIITINASILTLIFINDAYNFIHVYIGFNTLLLAYLFLNEAKLISGNIKISKLYNPSRIALIISLLFGLFAIGKKDLIPISQNGIWISSLIMFIVILYIVHTILKVLEIKTSKDTILIYLFSCFLLLPIIFAPSISGAILIILVSFYVNYKTGFAIGVLAFIYFISQYYYDLNYTLLTKSIILFSSGILFLLFYFITFKKSITNEKV